MSDAVAPAPTGAEASPTLAPSTPAPDGVKPPVAANPENPDFAKPKNRAERRAQAFAAAKASKEAREGAPTPPSASETPNLDAAPAPDAPKPVDAPALTETPKAPGMLEPPKPAADDDAKLRAAIQASIAKEREAYEAKKALQEHEKRVKEYEQKLKEREEMEAKRLQNPLIKAVLEGKSYEEITKDIVDGKLSAPDPRDEAIKGTKSELDQLKEQLAAMNAERQKEREAFEAQQRQQAEAAEMQQKAAQLSEELKGAAQHFPVLSALPWSAQQILAVHKQNPEKPLVQIARELEQRASQDVRHVFSSDASLNALLADKDIKDRVSKLLDIKPTQPAQQAPQGEQAVRNKPDAIPSIRAADPGDRKKPAKATTTEDRVKRGLAAVEARRRAQQG